MTPATFSRERYLAIRAAALETRTHDRAQAAAIAVALQRAATPPPVAPKSSGLLARLRRARGAA